jgi:hypothetical protein
MGHHLTGCTTTGAAIDGPYFTSFLATHYAYLEASHRNAGRTGDGEPEPVTSARLRRALGRVLIDVFRSKGRLEGRGEAQETEFDWLRLETEKLEELGAFLSVCIDEGVEMLMFW